MKREMRKMDVTLSRCTHHGIVLDVSSSGFDKGAATFGSVFADEDAPDTSLLFYSGARDVEWSHAAIGLAKSKDGFRFKKISNTPIFEGSPKSFCYKEALTPAITRIKNRFYMIFAGKPSDRSFRRLGIAYADDPEGPWHLIGQLTKATQLWEGRDIDNGPNVIKLDHETILVFYSNVTSWKFFDIPAILRRYPIRRIGLLKVRIRSPSKSGIEVYKFPANPLKHLNGAKASWNESVFCPGYIQLDEIHFLFLAASTYSEGFPCKQYIGVAAGEDPYFSKIKSPPRKLIDGPSQKGSLMPNIRGAIALDTPSPHLRSEKGELLLYYSVMDHADSVWKIALSSFDLPDVG